MTGRIKMGLGAVSGSPDLKCGRAGVPENLEYRLADAEGDLVGDWIEESIYVGRPVRASDHPDRCVALFREVLG
jgi:hypothetical protein